jgi:cation diffusion facilitator family transporter
MSHQHAAQDHDHEHDHGHEVGTAGHGAHGHTHGALDPSLLSNERGIRAIKISFLGLAVTALAQIVVALLSGSVALLADTIHNFGDAGTAIPLWIAFSLAKRAPSRRFTYGYGRVEDLAGVAIVLIMLASALFAAYESVRRIFEPQPVSLLWAVGAASIAGFLGNESVALFRIKVGREIGSAALIADGYHARVDGLTSLSVLIGVIGVALGFPLADPIVGLLITLVIFRIIWEAGGSVVNRLLEGVDPDVVGEIERSAESVNGVRDIQEVRVRWIGHWLHAEVNVAVDPELTVEQGHEIATAVRHQLLHDLRYLANVTVHVDPVTASGEDHHRVSEHIHGDLSPHSH